MFVLELSLELRLGVRIYYFQLLSHIH